MEHIFPRRDRRESLENRWLFGLSGAALLLWGIKRGSLFGGLLSFAGADLLTRSITGHHLYETAGITRFTAKGPNASVPHQLAIQVQRSTTINVPPEEVYAFVRDFRNSPQFVEHLQSVDVKDDTNSHWVLRGPANSRFEWDAEVINDTPNQLIAWRSVNRPDAENAGSIRFERAPQNRGTIVRVALRLMPPGGAIGALLASLVGRDPEKELTRGLRRLKQILEAGEVATTNGQPVGAYRGYLESIERRREKPQESVPSEETTTPRASSASA